MTDLESMRVLVVEDDRALSDLIEAVLVRKGLAVDRVHSGGMALAALQAGGERFDAVVLDLMIPRPDGFEILEALRSRPEILSRTIVLTAASPAVLKRLNPSPIVWCVMRKPFELEDFLSTLLECIAVHSGQFIPPAAAISRWFERRSAAIGAKAGVIAMARGDELVAAAEFGFPDGMTREIFPLVVTRKYPLTTAYRLRRDICLASLTLARAEYPLLLPIWTADDSQALASLPLDESIVTGAVGWSFGQPQAFGDDHRNALHRLASDCIAIYNRPSDASAT